MDNYIFTVADMMELPVMQGAIILAGRSGLGRRITSATVFDAPDGLKWLKGDEMVITTLYPFKDDLSLQLYFINRLCQGGAAALGIKLERYFRTLPEEVIQVANENDFPIISLPYDCAWIDLINPILAEVMNRQLLELKRSEEIHRSLTDLVLRGGTLKSIADVLYNLVQNPVLIGDFVTGNSACTPEEYFRDNQPVIHALPWREKEGDISSQAGTSNSVRRITIGEASVSYVTPVQVEKFIGGQIVVYETQRALHDLDIMAIEHAATVAALYLHRIKAVRELEQRFRNDFILRLLNGENADPALYLKRAEELGWHLQEQNLVIVCGVEQQNPWTANDYFQHVANYCLRDRLQKEPGLLMGLDLEGSLIIIYPFTGNNKERLIHEVTEISTMVVTYLRKKFNRPFYVGIGRPAYQLEEIARSYKEARLAKQISPAIDQENHVVSYDQCGVFRLLHLCTDNVEAGYYLEDYILPIIEWDREHEGKLFETLEVLLECGGNIRMTARKMFLHHNSISYRLSIIEKIIGCDMKNPQDRLMIFLGVKLYRLLMKCRSDNCQPK